VDDPAAAGVDDACTGGEQGEGALVDEPPGRLGEGEAEEETVALTEQLGQLRGAADPGEPEPSRELGILPAAHPEDAHPEGAQPQCERLADAPEPDDPRGPAVQRAAGRIAPGRAAAEHPLEDGEATVHRDRRHHAPLRDGLRVAANSGRNVGDEDAATARRLDVDTVEPRAPLMDEAQAVDAVDDGGVDPAHRRDQHLGRAPAAAQELDRDRLHHRAGEHLLEVLADGGKGGPGDGDPGLLHRSIQAGRSGSPPVPARLPLRPMGDSARGRAAMALGMGALLLALTWRVSPLPSPPMYEGLTTPAEAYRYLHPSPGLESRSPPSRARASVPLRHGLSPPLDPATAEMPPQAQLLAAHDSFALPPGTTAVV